MSRKSSTLSDLQKAFNKYSKFGKTQAQLTDHNGLRIGSASIQKMMKDCSIVDTNYTSQLLDNDIARVLGKLTIDSNGKNLVHYPKGTYVYNLNRKAKKTLPSMILIVFICRKTFEIKGFNVLLDRIAESKGVAYDDILTKINANERPSLNHATEITNKGITDRMTNTKYYT